MTPLELPDEPRWVEAHGMAGDPTSWRRELGDGFAIGNDTAKLIVLSEPTTSGVVELAREYPQHTLLVVTEELAAALRTAGREVDRAILHTLPDPDALPDLEGAVLLPADASLAHLPAALAEELEAARGTHAIWTAYVDGQPVSFAYVPWRSARWFDVSVDTLASARQLGLATIVSATMIRHERATSSREPVWGADEGNTASLRLAKRLGFVAVDELWVAAP